MNTILLGNIVALIGAVIMVLIGLIRSRKKILLAQSAQFAIMGLGNLILGGTAGAISNSLGIVRNMFCLKRDLPMWAKLLFIAAQTALTLGFNTEGWLCLLPIAAAAAFTLVADAKDPRILKYVIIFGQACWTIYDITIHNYVAVAFDLGTIVTTVISLVAIARGKAAS